MLANGGEDAPEGIWNAIQSQLEEAPPEMRLSVVAPAPTATADSIAPPPLRLPSEAAQPIPTPAADDLDELAARRARAGGRRADDTPSRRRWGLVAGVAAAVALVVTLGVSSLPGTGDGGSSVERIDLADAARPVLADPDARHASLTGEGGTAANVAVADDGTGFFVGSGLPALTDAETYQLWAVHADGRIVSVGLLGPAPEIVPFHVDGPVTQLVVTREVAGGVTSSENPAIVAGELD